jgi:hypothetical protein
MKTSELIGPALDWAVAKCEGMTNLRTNPHRFDQRLIMDGPEGNGVFLHTLNYSTYWAQGGPIIERERIQVVPYRMNGDDGWCAAGFSYVNGPTPLIAAMRCYCCAKLGDEIEIPQELQPCQQPKT